MLKKIAAVTLPSAFAVNQAYAALPADVTTALDAAKTDGVAVATAVLVAVVAIYAFKLMRNAL